MVGVSSYLNLDQHTAEVLTTWATVASAVFALASLVVVSVLTFLIYKWGHSTNSTYQCDSQFLEIEKIFLEDPKLYRFYNGIVPGWEDWSEDDQRMYILAEMHYFHLAFVHRESATRDPQYWDMCKRWLIVLLKRSEVFRKVWENEKGHFEKALSDEIDDLLKAKKEAMVLHAN